MEFIDLVARMREAQKEYFRTRTQEALRHSKDLEAKVDHVISTRNNLTLFP